MMMSTPFVCGIVENSMRIIVDGGGIRVAFFKRSTKRTPELVSCV